MQSEPRPRLVHLETTDAAVAVGFIAVCGEHIHRTSGLDHWYPLQHLDLLSDRFERSRLFGIRADDLLVGIFSLTDEPLPYYGDLSAFRLPAGEPRYLSGLAVLPSHQRAGVGHYAMKQAERVVRESGGDAIRFDAVTTNTPAVDFYRRLGYAEGGVIPVGHLTVTCFERLLDLDGASGGIDEPG
jgi:ribosomal protein S18 acetylase RimI-like enzyme